MEKMNLVKEIFNKQVVEFSEDTVFNMLCKYEKYNAKLFELLTPCQLLRYFIDNSMNFADKIELDIICGYLIIDKVNDDNIRVYYTYV